LNIGSCKFEKSKAQKKTSESSKVLILVFILDVKNVL